MTATRTCNGPGCGKTVPVEGMMGWMELEKIGILVATFGEGPGPWHFCSWECAAAFTSEQAGKW